MSLTSDKSTEAYRNWWPGRDSHADRRARAFGRHRRLFADVWRASWHPYLHLLVTDGALVSWPAHDTTWLTEAFRRAVLRRFVRLELLDENQAVGPGGCSPRALQWCGARERPG